MAKSPIHNPNFRNTGDLQVDAGREPVQLGWYEFAAEFCRGREVLDVGCGMAAGLDVLARTARVARGVDSDERLKRPDVEITDIRNLASDSVDVIVCIDVIEHVEEDLDFVKELVRIARSEVMLSTPNFAVSRCKWPYHVREYLPDQLFEICRPFGIVEMYKGTGDGRVRFPVKNPWAYGMLNRLLVSPLTNAVTRVYNHFLPEQARVASSTFIRLRLDHSRRISGVW